MAKDVERPLPKNTCKGKRPKQEALEQLRGQLEAYLNGLLAVSPGSTERLVAPRTLLEFLEYRSRVIVSAGRRREGDKVVGEEEGGR